MDFLFLLNYFLTMTELISILFLKDFETFTWVGG